jgi:glucose-1-phosphate thymidylyltransferase
VDIILPAAGLGTRLRPLTWSRPKPLVGLAGKTILDHVLDPLWPLAPSKLVFITGYLGDQIETYARARYDVPLAFVEQPEMRGQSDAIVRTRGLVEGAGLMVFPDAVFAGDLSILSTTDADAVMFVKEVDDPSALGVAVVEGERIVRLVEKPQEPVSNLAIVGIYWFRRMDDLYSAIDEQMARGVALKGEFYIADAIQIMIDRGAKIVPARLTLWEDCGNIENLLSTNRILLDRQPDAATNRDDAVVIPPSVVAPGATLERAVVGPYASIGDGATVRDAVVADAIVEDGATVERAVVEHALIGQRATVRGRAARLTAADASVLDL